MIRPGLVSVSFRDRAPSEIMNACAACGLAAIEWGSDVHAPATDLARLAAIAREQRDAGVVCSSYGSYFRVGKDAPADIEPYIAAAQALGTDTIRIWCGVKGSAEHSDADAARIVDACAAIVRTAEREGVKLCTEFHIDTFTDCAETVLALARALGSPSFKTYWQPNQNKSVDWNLAAARAAAPLVENIHVFNWRGNDKFPLADAIDEWQSYLRCFGGEHYALLEFMPDGRLESLATEAAALRSILEAIK